MTLDGSRWPTTLRRPVPNQSSWRPNVVLGERFLEERLRSAVPIDLRSIRQLQRSPLAIDLYVWLTYRMSYLKKPTLVPWQGLQAQFGADYSRLRDFRRQVLTQLQEVLHQYPKVRVSRTDTGLHLRPSPPHVRALAPKK